MKNLARLGTLATMSFLTFMAFCSEGRAAIVTFNFSGQISEVLTFNSLMPPAITVGDTFTGSFSYDTAAVANAPGFFTNQAVYSTGDNASISATIDSEVISSGSNDGLNYVRVWNGSSGIDFLGVVNGSDFGTYQRYTEIQLQDSQQSAFSSLALPTGLALGDFEYALFELKLYDTATRQSSIARGRITELVGTPTPEPTTLILWSLGALGCAVSAYRRRRPSSRSGPGSNASGTAA